MKSFLDLGPREIGKECRFSTYVRPPEPGLPDLHVVKEQIHLADGTRVPNLRLVEDYQRPYWVTKKGYQNYEQPKEWIERDRVNEFYTTESNLIYNAARSLGTPYFRGGLRDLAKNPYLYGVDIKSTALIKRDYQVKYPELKTEYTYGVFDTETDVVNGTEEVLMATFIFENYCFTAVQSSFLKGIANPVEQIEASTRTLLRKHADSLVIELTDSKNIKAEKEQIKTLLYNYVDETEIATVIVETELDVLLECFRVIHAKQPDFLSIWNLKFDIQKIEEACNRVGYPIESLLSDPSVPASYQSYKFILGPNQKRTSSGLIMPIKPAAQWHTVRCPASFYFIDAMCAYRHTRMGQQEKSSYSLDAILNEEISLGKLKLEAADQYTGLKWHYFMQTKYPVEYVVYNRFDCLGMVLLENKIKDLSVILPQFSGTSDFEDFKSQPRRKMDALHWFVQSQGRVMGTTSESLVDPQLDHLILNRKDWIVALAPSLVTEEGLKIIKEAPDLVTSIYSHVGDLDVAASYPNGECAFNISKETTVREICKIEGISEETLRKQNMGLSAGFTNAVDYCSTMFNFPTLFELEDLV